MNLNKMVSFLMILVLYVACNPVDKAKTRRRRVVKMQQNFMRQKLAKMLINRRKHANKLIF